MDYNFLKVFIILIPLMVGCDSGPSLTYGVLPGQIHIRPALADMEDAEVFLNGQRVSGQDYEGHPVQTEPVRVRTGVPFTVRTFTFAGGCWESASPSTIMAEGRTATVSVFDEWIVDGDIFCTAEQRREPRTDAVTFSEAGEAVVVVRGAYFNLQESVPEEAHVPYELRFEVIVE